MCVPLCLHIMYIFFWPLVLHAADKRRSLSARSLAGAYQKLPKLWQAVYLSNNLLPSLCCWVQFSSRLHSRLVNATLIHHQRATAWQRLPQGISNSKCGKHSDWFSGTRVASSSCCQLCATHVSHSLIMYTCTQIQTHIQLIHLYVYMYRDRAQLPDTRQKRWTMCAL